MVAARTPARCSPGSRGGTTGAQVARAALEGIAWRVADVVAAIRETVDVDSLRVDGGLTNEPLMLELQADAIGAPVEAGGADATVLGAAALAAVGSGMIASLAEAAELLPVDRRVEPEPRRRRGARPSTSAGASSSPRPRRSTRSSATISSPGLAAAPARHGLLLDDAHALVELDLADRAGVALVHAEHPRETRAEQNHSDDERRVVEEAPVEVVLPRHSEAGEGQHRTMNIRITKTTAIALIHLYLGPSVQERGSNESPARQRR